MSNLTDWSKKLDNSALVKEEIDALSKFISSLRGYHLMLLGKHKSLEWLPKHCLHAFSLSPEKSNIEMHIQSSYSSLPLRQSSIDAAVIPYLLEYTHQPETILEELFRALIAEGKLYILGFNRVHPWCWFNTPPAIQTLSLWKIKKLILKCQFNINDICWLHYGSIYLIEAQKQIASVTPLRPLWSTPALEKTWQPTARKIG